MSYPITTNDVADILSALGRPDAAANVRWSERDLGARHLSEVESLRAEVDELRAELAHATDDADRAWSSLCKKCQAKREAA